MGLLFCQLPRPKPIHEHAPAVLRLRRFIDAFDPDIHEEARESDSCVFIGIQFSNDRSLLTLKK